MKEALLKVLSDIAIGMIIASAVWLVISIVWLVRFIKGRHE